MEASLAGATKDLWDVAPLAWSSVCCENAVVLATIKDAAKAARPRHSSADSLCGSAVFFLKCLCDAHKNNDRHFPDQSLVACAAVCRWRAVEGTRRREAELISRGLARRISVNEKTPD
jgi:hypothetical protein